MRFCQNCDIKNEGMLCLGKMSGPDETFADWKWAAGRRLGTPGLKGMICARTWRENGRYQVYNRRHKTMATQCTKSTRKSSDKLLGFVQRILHYPIPFILTKNLRWKLCESPGGLVHMQIECILPPSRYKSTISKVKTKSHSGTDMSEVESEAKHLQVSRCPNSPFIWKCAIETLLKSSKLN